MSKKEMTLVEAPGTSMPQEPKPTIEVESQEIPSPRSKMKSEPKGGKSRSVSVWTMTQAGRRSGGAMFKGRFCCCFALQAGVCMYSSMGFVLMICVFMTNITGEIHELDHGYEWIAFPILYIYVLAMLAGYGLTYFGTVKPSLKWLRIGNWLVLVFSVYWMIISCLSFVDVPNIIRSVCIDRRCPETQWLVKTYFRTYGDDCELGEDPLVEDEGNQTEEVYVDKDMGRSEDDNESLGETLPEHLEHNQDMKVEHISDSVKINKTKNSQPNLNHNRSSSDVNRQSGLEGLDLIRFESRLIGCAMNTKLYRTLSILAMLYWAGFVINGIVGGFLLIRKIRRATITGEVNHELTHIGFAQERQERMSRNYISAPVT
ncbi:hypothetical protein GE061_013423 [Apolygus lucorum]|uniref:Uncharacterized protein n=1 Tax=Apolygus lucorum TaxID=248454 RepID=A0A6A4K9J9_APOLU|nr:hypothetical protein GE061_013423 [Apolygus lucorum]